MKRKGIQFSRANHLTFRYPTDEDTYMDGTEVDGNYVIFESWNTGKEVPLDYHSRTNMAYGKVRNKRNRPYKTQPVYWAEDGRVFQGTVRIWDN